MELSPLCKICGKDLNKTTECAWTSCPLLYTETLEEKRMNIIGQNGNDGEIYHWLHKHGHRPKNKCSPTYSSWLSMKSRCKTHEFYVKNKITYSPEWEDFIMFLADMGEKPPNTTIDRLDNNKGYSKDNCRWATVKQQARNKKSNIFVTMFGECMCLVDWARKYNIPTTTMYRRFHSGLRGTDLIKPSIHSKRTL